MYELVVKRGTVINPSANLHGKCDIASGNGLIAQIAPTIAAEETRRVSNGHARRRIDQHRGSGVMALENMGTCGCPALAA